MRAWSMGLGAWGRSLLAVVLMLGMASAAFSQTAEDPGEGLRIDLTGTPNVRAIKWWGKTGHTYFVQSNPTLNPNTWSYMPVVEAGANALLSWNLSTTGPRMFVRLVYTDVLYSGSASSADFDGDGLTNAQEVASNGPRSNPFNADTDDDGFSDSVEWGGSYSPVNSSQNPDANGGAFKIEVRRAWSISARHTVAQPVQGVESYTLSKTYSNMPGYQTQPVKTFSERPPFPPLPPRPGFGTVTFSGSEFFDPYTGNPVAIGEYSSNNVSGLEMKGFLYNWSGVRLKADFVSLRPRIAWLRLDSGPMGGVATSQSYHYAMLPPGVTQTDEIEVQTPEVTSGGAQIGIGGGGMASVILKIWNGQSASEPVPEEMKHSVGAFTVANLNNTDGDGIIDKDDADVPGEKDLMRLQVGGFKGRTGKVRLTVTSGNVKLWAQSDKKTEIQQSNGTVLYDLPAGGLNMILWVEATDVSQTVRDIEITAGYQDAQGQLQGVPDKVRATAVWAEHVPTTTKKENSDTMWQTASQPLKDFFDDEIFKFGPAYDTGWSAAQYAIGFEFKTLPPGLFNEPSVVFDIARQHEGNIWSIVNNVAQAVPGESIAWPQQNDQSNDDIKDDDEDAEPDNDRLYSIDAPSFSYVAASLYDEAVLKFNFKEFVRVWFKPGNLGGNNSNGSRCSAKIEWNAQGWVTKTAGSTPGFPAYAPKANKPNNVFNGLTPITTPQP